jgi:hypothetical protein
MPIFTDEQIGDFEKNPIQSTLKLIRTTDEVFIEEAAGNSKFLSDSDFWTEEHLDVLMEATALVNEVIKSINVTFTSELPSLENDLPTICIDLRKYLLSVENEFQAEANLIKFSSYQNRFQLALKS